MSPSWDRGRLLSAVYCEAHIEYRRGKNKKCKHEDLKEEPHDNQIFLNV